MVNLEKGQGMSDRYNDRQTSDSRDPNAKNASRAPGNRDESMKDSGKDAFGQKNPRPDRTASSQADGTTRSEDLDPASSGTAPLAGETPESSDRQSPGGVEGPGGSS